MQAQVQGEDTMLFVLPLRVRQWIAGRLRARALSRGRCWTTHSAKPAPRVFGEAIAMPKNRYYLYQRARPGTYVRIGIAMTVADAKCWCRGVPMVPIIRLRNMEKAHN